MKNCPSYDGYSITANGEVYTHRRRYGKGKGHGGGVIIDDKYNKRLNVYKGHGGYLYVSISTNGKQRSIPVHVLLTDTFMFPRPEGYEVRHLDGNPLNNSLNNLTYGTKKDNAQDRIKCGNHTIGIKHGRAKLTEFDVHNIRYFYSIGESIASMARRYKRGESTIRDIVKKRNWKHI